MTNEQLAAALRRIAEGLYEAADVLFGVPEPTTTAGAVLTRPVTFSTTSDNAPTTLTMPDFPPMEETYEAVPLPADTPGLGRCPSHGIPWSVKGAGVSKAGKPYNAFFKCDGKDPDGSYCQKKPTRAWADAHPIAA